MTSALARAGWTHVCYVVEAAENIFPGLFGFKSRLFLVLFRGLKETFGVMNTHRVIFVQMQCGSLIKQSFLKVMKAVLWKQCFYTIPLVVQVDYCARQLSGETPSVSRRHKESRTP